MDEVCTQDARKENYFTFLMKMNHKHDFASCVQKEFFSEK